MDIAGSIALVTGANRGIGRHVATQLLARGAATVYATARNPDAVDVPGARVLALDITDPASVAAAAQAAGDVTLLVNNAGISTYTDLVSGDLEKIRLEVETHVFGTLAVVRAFAPVLAATGGGAGGGAILNVLSALSWTSYQGATAYAAAKAAEWSLTNGIRLELAGQRTLVTGLHTGSVDTDMMAGWDVPKNDPADVVRAALDGIEADALEVLVDDASRQAKAALGLDPSAVYPQATPAAWTGTAAG
ncbi:SDR family oxidoreductase [Quadrisphaera sp. DSM 44207]|uniref:SDR family oxidoreductase n=1 Tax=Quadrisphaera sp. DSM 44207 TaxID=1881057 RepID=UPI00087FE50A|nr:SDR family oxidoreductase [Quadrisphaera sp. DSM 44207]SDQ39813.1 Short-chain dehydrogenase [Quadrisphaera sp. DSM 44207]